jgi:drug/metabolite transporter (DMT)-like permease
MTTSALSAAAAPAAADGRARVKVALALATLYLVWGSTYLALRWVVEAFPPMLAAGARYFLAGTLLLLVGRLRGAAIPRPAVWLRAAPVGLLLFVVGNGFVSLAEREVASSQAAIVCASMPLFAVLVGAVVGERPRRLELVGLLVGFAGVLVLTAAELGSASRASLLLLFAPVGWAIGSVATRRLSLPGGTVGAALPMIWGGMLAAPLGLALGESPTGAHPSFKAIAAFAYLLVAGSMIAFTAYAYLLRNVRPSLATSYAYVNPVVATVLGIILGGERLGAHTLLGGVLVVVGVGAVMLAKTEKLGELER